ncbi:MAG: ABC-F family ATP-binding cassette domain-containing protein [Synergistaceae bacterium]|nr:ABC-F family ATP-binding cassette domain-containing protein [Synergistaceae bacterium]
MFAYSIRDTAGRRNCPLIDIKGLRLAFGEKVIFDGFDWLITDRARFGLVGDNGAGKTTLLRVLMKEMEPDAGSLERSKNLTVGYLPQDLVELEDRPVLEYLKQRVGLAEIEEKLRDTERVLAETDARSRALGPLLDAHQRLERQFEHLGGFEFESMARKVLRGLGFAVADAERSCSEFSGGWKMRVALAALLLTCPDVLLLDEPTNHLDTESMEWLEAWLRDYRGAVVAVSHDRRFLDDMTEQIAELARGKLTLYPWSYERYLIEKEGARERLEKAAAEQKSRIDGIERFISRFRYKSSKAAQVQSRIRQLEKMELLEPEGRDRTVRFRIPEAPESGRETLRVQGLSKSYDAFEVFRGVDFTIDRGERVALIGVNGAGKSTLLRLLSGVDEPTAGVLRLGHNVKCAFYSQESAQNVDYTRSVWEEARGAPSKLNEADRRNLLGAFLFSGEDIHKPVSVLSGGEKARLALFKLMLTESNFLILDEPTNHLDLNTKELFQRALLQYAGTLLIVSHDRHFLDNLAERVLELRDGRLYDYPGNYSWFLEKREEFLKQQPGETEGDDRASGGRRTRDEKKREAGERERLLQKRRAFKKEIGALEAGIERTEARRDEVDGLLCRPEVLADSGRVQLLMRERDALTHALNEDYARWETLMSRMEEV